MRSDDLASPPATGDASPDDALRRERHRTETILRTLPVVVCSFALRPDGSSWVPFASPSLEDIYGLTPDDVAADASPMAARVHPDDAARVVQSVAESARSLQPWHCQFRVIHPRRGELWVEGHSIPQREPDGSTVWHGILSDVTERQRTAETLGRQAALLDQSYDAILIWEWDGAITFWNRGAQHLYGYSTEEVVGRVSHDVFRTASTQGVRGMLEQLEAAGHWEGELEHSTRDGRRLTVESRMTVVRRDGRSHVLEVNRDMTARKAAEAEILRMNETLEHRVQERTAELRATNEQLEAFSYSVSHDLRAPLRAIDGYSQALLEEYESKLGREGVRYLRTVRLGAQRMGRLIDDLLAFSRLSRQELGIRAVDMASLVRDALDELGAEQAGRDVAVTVHSLPPCQGDPALLRQVWSNLLSNALKYSRQRPRAEIEVGALDEDGRTVYFVRDNGTGFDPRFRDKLFGVFQRLHRAEDYEGTGVGLAIVARIVRRHRGRVWADAEEGRGATFSFTIETSCQDESLSR